ncbi:MAG: 16S rRNA (uracil(1498)-N(3))-methyltransferase [Candidatus Omnitrophica bacterium]|nr:16S rRNA (uracil(1498)-N(3))-methyltransferase [Candidatus Omnitrophota bacterium]
MRRDRFYLENLASLEIRDIAALHKIRKVLRKKKKDLISVFDGKGSEYEVRIKEITHNKIEFDSPSIRRKAKQIQPKISLAFPVLKSQRSDFLISKAVELGIDALQPFISENNVAKRPGSSKFAHWKRIVIESACQSKRLFLPGIKSVISVEAIFDAFDAYDLILLADPTSDLQAESFFGGIKTEVVRNLLLVVGPEGGFSPRELDRLKVQNNLKRLRISNFVLRSETACVFLSGLTCHYFNKSEI